MMIEGTVRRQSNEKCKMQNETVIGRDYIFHFSFFITRSSLATWDPALAGLCEPLA